MNALRVSQIVVLACLGLGWIGFLVLCSISTVLYKALSERAAEGEANCATLAVAPLPASVITNLCDNHLIPVSLGECGDTLPQLQRQHVRAIVESNVVENVSTYEDVSKMLGAYETYCEQTRRHSEFSCDYDISGLGPRARIDFSTTTNRVVSIRVIECGSGS